MKLIIRDYLGSLKEREELDAILPDLLSELGFIVYSKPTRGTRQYGVDIAAVGNDDDGERKIFLFSVKQGDLNRQDWDGTPQGLRSSLNEIRDVYIPTRIPKRYRSLKIVICLCFGGDVQEQVRTEVTLYTEQNSTPVVSFDEWNGDRIASLLMHGILREEILPKDLRASFQKSVAMVEQPDVAYFYFSELVKQLCMKVGSRQKSRITVARQIYICLWILFVWARSIDNLEAPYRASELALLNVWHLLRPLIDKSSKDAKSISTVLHQLIELHGIVAAELLDKKIIPHTAKLHAISSAVESRNSVDINLKLFDLIGRIALRGIWQLWAADHSDAIGASDRRHRARKYVQTGFELILNNPALTSPLCDQQAIDIALFLLLAAFSGDAQDSISSWLHEMTVRLNFAFRLDGKYLCVFTEYRDLIEHPKEHTDVYRREATSGSILIPLIAAWLAAFKDESALKALVNLQKSKLQHCTLQLWLPDAASEDQLYIGERDHGLALCDIPLSETGEELFDTITEACLRERGFENLSSNRTGYWPIILLACRHYRYPVPPQFWINLLHPTSKD